MAQGFSRGKTLIVAGSLALAATPAHAHGIGGVLGGFIDGLAHPILGPDHLAAMVAVGILGAFLGAPAIWTLPIVFPMVMTAGAVLAIVGVPLPGVEIGVRLSAMVLGLIIAFAVRPPLRIAVVLVGLFAIFHGYAHGAELRPYADVTAYAIGFVIMTGILHLIGIGFGLLSRWR